MQDGYRITLTDDRCVPEHEGSVLKQKPSANSKMNPVCGSPIIAPGPKPHEFG